MTCGRHRVVIGILGILNNEMLLGDVGVLADGPEHQPCGTPFLRLTKSTAGILKVRIRKQVRFIVYTIF